MDSRLRNLVMGLFVMTVILKDCSVDAWAGEIRGRVVCDSSTDQKIIVLEGAEVAVLCITKSGEIMNYQAFTNSKGVYIVAETMPESERWDACLARPISSFHTPCNHLHQTNTRTKFTNNRSFRLLYDAPTGADSSDAPTGAESSETEHEEIETEDEPRIVEPR